MTSDLDLLTRIDEALDDPHPLPLLLLASGMMTVFDPRRHSPFEQYRPAEELSSFGREQLELPTIPKLCEMFLEVGQRQTDALLLVLARLQRDDDVLAARIRREVAARRLPIPGWLLRLDQVEPVRAVQMTHVLGDGDNVVVGVSLPGNRECSIIVYIDHNLGTVVKDAFVIGLPLDETIESWNQADPIGDTDIEEVPLADARAKITQAIDTGAMTFPPFETDTWPGCRPLTEWVVSMMPKGGSGYERPDWGDEQLATLADEFFESEFGSPMDTADHRALLAPLLSFGADYGPGDPLRWSPIAVEMVLMDWIPRKLAYPTEELAEAPHLLRALIRYSHRAREIPRDLTTQTLTAVDEWEPAYLEAIEDPEREEHSQLLTHLAELHEESTRLESLSVEEYMLEVAANAVGGHDVLDQLDVSPLPDEEFDWSGLPDDIRDRVSEVLILVDECSTAVFDSEFRTANRRLLARIAVGDPQIFRRKSAARTAAAAVCWIIGQANESFSRNGMFVKDLMAHFGLSGSISQRAEVFLRAVRVEWPDGPSDLGTLDFLVAARRESLVRARDYYRGRLAAQDDDEDGGRTRVGG